MNIFSTFFSSIYRVLKLLAKARFVSPYLKSGIYHISLKKRSIIRGFGLPLVIGKNKKSQSERASFIFGEWTKKIVFIFDDIVVSTYNRNGCIWNRNIEKFIENINYKKVTYLLVNPSKKYNLTERVVGVVRNDLYSAILIAKDIVNALSKDTIQTKSVNQLLCENYHLSFSHYYVVLQHGDLSIENCIWINDFTYKIIDFDTIGFKPFLYDLFRLIILHFKEDGLISYVKGEFDLEIKDFFARNELEFENLEFEKDKYLAIFILSVHKYWDILAVDFSYLPKDYKNTISILDKIHSQEGDLHVF